MNSLLSKAFDALGKAVEGNDVDPEECTDCDQLIERGPEEKVEEVDFPCILQALLFNDIH